MISVLIPAHNEQKYLNRTIQNIRESATGDLEVLVYLDGYIQTVLEADVVVPGPRNAAGERVAMNVLAERAALGSHFLRIDAHCDFSPKGWDEMLVEVTDKKTITQAVLTAVDPETWERLPGHLYQGANLVKTYTGDLPGLEAKWANPNRDKAIDTIIPNMSSTGCGFLIHRDFWDEIGGANEDLPAMGAIGEEFCIKAWLAGGTVQTRTDVMIGHIFGTGGYGTGSVRKAQQMLWDMYGDRYEEILAKFPDVPLPSGRTAVQETPGIRAVIVRSTDVRKLHDPDTGRLLRERVETYRYDWLEDEHPEERGWTDAEIEDKYKHLGIKEDEVVSTYNAKGELVSNEGENTDGEVEADPEEPEVSEEAAQ
jgi:hypothetical protein